MSGEFSDADISLMFIARASREVVGLTSAAVTGRRRAICITVFSFDPFLFRCHFLDHNRTEAKKGLTRCELRRASRLPSAAKHQVLPLVLRFIAPDHFPPESSNSVHQNVLLRLSTSHRLLCSKSRVLLNARSSQQGLITGDPFGGARLSSPFNSTR
jgi:hypothetical protein